MCEYRYSVLMSVYHKEKSEYLKKSIQSVMEQTVRPDEFIIVKDGKLTDELNDVINDFLTKFPRIFTIIENDANIGLGASLAKGILASRNELIARMDSDDLCVNTRCEKQLYQFQLDENLEIVGTYEAEFIDDIDNIVSVHKVPKYNEDIKEFMRRRCAILHPTVMYKKSSVINSGNYRDVPLYEDYDLFARMVLDYNAKCINLDENLYYIRTSEDFFKRRGGVKYAKTVLKFKYGMLRKKNMSFIDFIVSGFGQAFVCILPNSVRRAFYMTFLRK